MLRDRRAKAALRRLGYRVLVIWECQLRDRTRVVESVRKAIADESK
jgi:G:T-mismatch repair DNA endonuclease (very short patch repair protein)